MEVEGTVPWETTPETGAFPCDVFQEEEERSGSHTTSGLGGRFCKAVHTGVSSRF